MRRIKRNGIIGLFILLFVFSGICCAAADDNAYTIEDYTVIDNEYATFTIKRIENEDTLGTTVKAFLENKTEKNLWFSIENSTVNGYACDPFWASELPSGKKANQEITFYDLDEIGISTIEKWSFRLMVSDSDDFLADPFIDEEFTIYPTGLDEASVAVPERRETDKEKVICSDENMEFIILDTNVDDIWGYNINCYLENKTDSPLTFSWDDVSVNGFMCDPFWATDVPAHTKAYSSVSFYDDLLEENDLTYDDIAEIEFTLRVYDADDWLADDLIESVYTYTAD